MGIGVGKYKINPQSSKIDRREDLLKKDNIFFGRRQVPYSTSKVAYTHCEVVYAALSNNFYLNAGNGILKSTININEQLNNYLTEIVNK